MCTPPPHHVQCWCGAESVRYDRHGYASCDRACSGDGSEICGGYNAFTLYYDRDGPPTIDPTPAPAIPPHGRYEGCYRDDRHNRVLSDKYSTNDMDNEVRGGRSVLEWD